MADSSIAIVSSGGTLVDTRTNVAGDHRQVIVIADQTANDAVMTVTSSDAGVGTSEYGAVVRPLMTDAAKLRVSAIIDNGSVSAKQSDATNLHVSAKSDSAGQIRVSAFSDDGAKLRVSAILGASTANIGYVSAVLDNGSVSAKSSDAGTLLVSAKQGDAALLRVSSFLDSGSVSARQSDAANLLVSAKSDSAGQLRVSASLFPDTAGGLTIAQSLSVSSIQTVKGSAGALYGYYMFNKDTKINFVKLYNLSAGAQIGTDTPVLTIPLPISGGANAWFGNGLAGFTAGIQMGATSGLPVDNTAAPAASAVVVDLFYK